MNTGHSPRSIILPGADFMGLGTQRACGASIGATEHNRTGVARASCIVETRNDVWGWMGLDWVVGLLWLALRMTFGGAFGVRARDDNATQGRAQSCAPTSACMTAQSMWCHTASNTLHHWEETRLVSHRRRVYDATFTCSVPSGTVNGKQKPKTESFKGACDGVTGAKGRIPCQYCWLSVLRSNQSLH